MPSGQFYKNGWFQPHNLQQDILKESKTISLLYIGDSIAYSFKRYSHICDKYYGNLVINCGIAGHKAQNTLWRAENLTLPGKPEYAVIICGINNINHNNASSIANGLLCVALTLVSKSVQQVIIWGIQPRDFVNTIRRDKIKEANELLKIACSKLKSSLIHGTRFGPPKKTCWTWNIFTKTTFINWRNIWETCQNLKCVIDECIPMTQTPNDPITLR